MPWCRELPSHLGASAWPCVVPGRLPFNRQLADAEPGLLHGDYGSVAQLLLDEGENGEHRSCPIRGASSGPAKQDDAGSGSTSEGKQSAEVGVGGDDGPSVRAGSGEDLIVGGAAQAEIGDVHGVVAGFGKDACEILLERLVNEELHAVAGSGMVTWSTAAAANSSACLMSSSVS